MHPFFSSIKAVGFDLDNTLYPKDPNIDSRVKREVSKKILEKKPELICIEEAEEYCEKRYKKLKSRVKVLEEVGFINPKKVMYKCMLNADIPSLLKPNPELVSI